jgi:hypothetical protein
MTLHRLFVLVAIIEAFYSLSGLLLPPAAVGSLLGWQLSPDGHWVTKLLGAALLAQAATAWLLRHRPPRGIAVVLAGYQLAAVGVDALVLLFLDGALVHPVARASALLSIPTHGLIGVLLLIAAARSES